MITVSIAHCRRALGVNLDGALLLRGAGGASRIL
jgi:hypothetical protein